MILKFIAVHRLCHSCSSLPSAIMGLWRVVSYRVGCRKCHVDSEVENPEQKAGRAGVGWVEVGGGS